MARTRRNRPSARSLFGSRDGASAPKSLRAGGQAAPGSRVSAIRDSGPSRLILASASPRRRSLLEALAIEFEVVDPGVDELTEGVPAEVVVANALSKAQAGARFAGPATVIGADTDVVVDGEILGKPTGAQDARAMIERLSGRSHEVHGGLAVLAPDGGERIAHEVTIVRFVALESALVDAYVAAGAWRGYAGAYAIQGAGAMLVDAVEGDLANVIGLPLRALAGLTPGLLPAA